MTSLSPSVLFVCLGNICRSPLAEGLARAVLPDWRVDSAAVGTWHVGQPPDPRAIAVAAAHGLDISGQRARRICAEDFDRFDWILCADAAVLAEVRRLRPLEASAGACELLLAAAGCGARDVPDPYHGTQAEFEAVFDLLCTAMSGLDKLGLARWPGACARMGP